MIVGHVERAPAATSTIGPSYFLLRCGIWALSAQSGQPGQRSIGRLIAFNYDSIDVR